MYGSSFKRTGLIVQAFSKHKEAVTYAKQLASRCPSVRTELRQYLIAINSQRSYGMAPKDKD